MQKEFKMIGKKTLNAAAAALIALPFLLSSPNAETLDRVVILTDTPKITRWAVIHQEPDPAHNDPYYHLEAFEHKKGAQPWEFKRLAHHIVITGEALEKSRNNKRAGTYAYKDVEFWVTYKMWRDNPEIRAQTPVCETSLKDCLERATDQK
ncbi:DUF5086 family protein [Ochrobactrum sp. AN78]|uniref:DUF5086 family protein n=1 Tax=Ochrobactrum sp. AN78 TaxID=3039853 RepID=UPI002989E0CC|nr:DUF5086 family protein [Ochrobactrum sp. AN78]MDH7793447.1 hypothetical protein [Ochrobactrum sp. AN78]